MKRLQLNGKRMAKNVVRPLLNGTVIQAGDHKFLWKCKCIEMSFWFWIIFSSVPASSTFADDTKFSKSYSVSPNKPSPGLVIKNRKTFNRYVRKPLHSSHFLIALYRSLFANAENNQTAPPINDKDKDAASETEPSVEPVNKMPPKRRSSYIPVKPNRTSELRRASIARSKSIGHDLFQCHTPKNKILPSAAMAKSVSAIMRSESRGDHHHRQSASWIAKRKSFPKMIDGLDLFNVVTNEMKSMGPSSYIQNKFGSARNSPKRTPKSALLKPKRLSLRSEVSE